MLNFDAIFDRRAQINECPERFKLFEDFGGINEYIQRNGDGSDRHSPLGQPNWNRGLTSRLMSKLYMIA